MVRKEVNHVSIASRPIKHTFLCLHLSYCKISQCYLHCQQANQQIVREHEVQVTRGNQVNGNLKDVDESLMSHSS
jgi:hypothetical protein